MQQSSDHHSSETQRSQLSKQAPYVWLINHVKVQHMYKTCTHNTLLTGQGLKSMEPLYNQYVYTSVSQKQSKVYNYKINDKINFYYTQLTKWACHNTIFTLLVGGANEEMERLTELLLCQLGGSSRAWVVIIKGHTVRPRFKATFFNNYETRGRFFGG